MYKPIIEDKIKKIKKTNDYYRQKANECNKKDDNSNILSFDDETYEIDKKIKKYPSIIKKNTFMDHKLKFKNPFKSRNKLQLKKIKTFNIPILNHCNSITTNTSVGEKMKKVTFSTVEIIRVEKYKKYNAICTFSKNQIMKNMEEAKHNQNESNACSIF